MPKIKNTNQKVGDKFRKNHDKAFGKKKLNIMSDADRKKEK